MRTETISWTDVKQYITAAGCTRLAFDIIDCLLASQLKCYGYGSRFNGLGRDHADSDWDFAVECSEEEWQALKSAVGELGFFVFEWLCGGRPDQPVFSNYPDSCFRTELERLGLNWTKSKKEINVRRVASENDLGIHPNGGWKLIS
jgi:hypothetical protein